MTLEILTLQSLLQEASRRYEDAPALAFVDDKPISYKKVEQAACGLAARLIQLGIEKGDRVALLAENMPNWGVAYFAAAAAGAVIVPVLPDFTADDVDQIIQHSGSKAVFVSDKMKVKVAGAEERGISVISMSDDGFLHGETAEGISPERIVEPDDLAAIIYTSGTTGSPKGVMLSHGNIVSNVVAAAPIPQMKERERLLSILPLSHTYECTIGLLVPFSLGACVYYIKKPPTPNVLKEALQKVKPGVMLSVPLLIEKIYRQNVRPSLTKSAVVRALSKFLPSVNYSIGWPENP